MVNNNQVALLELLKASLFGMTPVFPRNTDWDKVLEEANLQTVTAIAAKSVPEVYSANWKMAVMQTQARSIQVLHGQTQLIDLFRKAEIPFVILKGATAAKYYPDPFLRAMGDVDILVPQKQFDEAYSLMLSSGYQCINEKEISHRDIEFTNGGVLFELHHHFSSDGFACDAILENAIYQRSWCNLKQYEFPVLPEMENGLVLLGHIHQHLKNNALGMRQIIDWMMFVYASLTDEAWENRFRGLVQDVGLELFAINVTKLCKNWLGLPDYITWCDIGDDQLTETLLSILFESGNMGMKSATSRGMVERVSLQIKRKGLLRWLYDYGCRRLPAAKKYKLLSPLAIVYGIGRITVKGIAAKLKGTNITEQIAKGDDRYDVYRKLGLNIASRKFENSKEQ